MPSPADRFEASLDRAERHALGAHYTRDPDILKVVVPTIERPWTQRIDQATSREQLAALHDELANFHVLDPACGCGNFLLVAYHALRRLESRILARLHHEFAATLPPRVDPRQLHGLDIDPRAVEIARTTLQQAHQHATSDPPRTHATSDPPTSRPHATSDPPATHPPATSDPPATRPPATSDPLARPPAPSDLTATIVHADALRTPWPAVSAIIGNPPFLDARKLAREHGPASVADLRRRFPDVPGRADLCVYFFKRAHDHLRPGQRAGLVGTNTIRQNYSREGGLDYIIHNGGTITDAVATQVWSGDAAVHVSIVNWIKGEHTGPCELTTQLGDSPGSPWRTQLLPKIPPTLSTGPDVSSARALASSARSFCYEGIQPGHRGFRLTADEYHHLVQQHPTARACIAPYMTGDALLSGDLDTTPEYLIDLSDRTESEAAEHPALLAHIKRTVLPDWQANAARERQQTGKPSGEHQNRLINWWHLKRPRPALQQALRVLPRYIACSRVTKRPIFAFLDSLIRPDSSLTVFAAADDYTFGVLQSSLHWLWFQARCSTLKGDHRYTSNTVFDTFPWPQSPSTAHVHAVAAAALALRTAREHSMRHDGMSLRDLYRSLETADHHPLRAAHADLDHAVRAAYLLADAADPLSFLLALNHDIAHREARGLPILGPGLPPRDRHPAREAGP